MNHRAQLELLGNLLNSYQQICKPLCRRLQLPQTAFDILMFFANNPEYNTASDVVEVRGIKANLVSINVDKLVQEGLLERRSSQTDRRVVYLAATKKADDIIQEGHRVQKQYIDRLFANVSKEEKAMFDTVLSAIGQNANEMMKELQS